MDRDAFFGIRTWVFDLDNTLYPPAARLFDQIERRMTDWVSNQLGVETTEADRLRHLYWHAHGTTLAGLMAEHAIDPEPFLDFVHDIDLGHLTPDRHLVDAIAALPGRKIVYTNGSRGHARRILAARDLTAAFDAIYGIEDAGYEPKPRRSAFSAVFGKDGLDTRSAAMFEDEARNLEVPFYMGLRTVHVSAEPEGQDFVHHHTTDLGGFLSQVAGAPFPQEASAPRFGA